MARRTYSVIWLPSGQAAVASVTTRAETAERLLEDARAELQAERDRNDVRLSQLHQQPRS